MSRFYGMSVLVSNHDPTRADAIIETAEEEWPFGGLTDNGTSLSGYGEDNLIAGCSEKDFAEQFTLAIWRVNGAYCDVKIVATYLENLPCETYYLEKADYARLITGKCDEYGEPDIYPVEIIGCPTHEPDEKEECTNDGE